MPIRFGTYNIRNRRNGGLESTLRVMSQANMYLGIFLEKKCTDGIYTHESAGYCVVATDAPSRHRGGVALFYRPSPLFAVEAVREYGSNVLSFELVTGELRWYIIGCYLTPDDTLMIERVVATDAPSRHRGGVALFYRTSPLFAVEAVRKFGLNVMSLQLATGSRRWYIIGCYLAPDDISTIESVVAALK